LVDSSLTLLNLTRVGCQRNFAGWIKQSESTKKRKVSRFTLVATYEAVREEQFFSKSRVAQKIAADI